MFAKGFTREIGKGIARPYNTQESNHCDLRLIVEETLKQIINIFTILIFIDKRHKYTTSTYVEQTNE